MCFSKRFRNGFYSPKVSNKKRLSSIPLVCIVFSLHFARPLLLSKTTVRVHHVDVEHPEQNGDFTIVPFTDCEKEGKLHNGFDILIDGDIPDYINERYKARQVAPCDILVSRPLARFPYHEHFDKFFDILKESNEFCERTKVAHDITRNVIRIDDSRKNKHVILRFPDEMPLSTRYYSDADGELTTECVPFEYEVEFDGQTFTRSQDTVFWKVAVERPSQR